MGDSAPSMTLRIARKQRADILGALSISVRVRARPYSDFTMSSVIFFASARSIIVLSLKKSGFSTPA